jgi:hypothetical protein
VRVRAVAWCLIVSLAFLLPVSSFAHGAEGGIVLLLPTGYYLAGAAFVVAITFLLFSVMPQGFTHRLYGGIARLPAVAAPSGAWISLASFLIMAVLVLSGFFGSRDPLLNPLPAVIWTLWWVCLTIAHGLFGDFWRVLNPWSGPLHLMRRVTKRPAGERSLLSLPAALGYAPALVQFYAFAWFELVDLSPSDPARLAMAVSLYWCFNLAAMLVFGEKPWRQRGEPFSLAFFFISRLAPIGYYRRPDGRLCLFLCWPGKQLFDLPPLSASGIAFILLTLSTVTFDGFSRTFVWLSAIGVNPLEFPGRSAVVVSSSLGILIAFAALSILFFGSVFLGCLLSGTRSVLPVAGRLIYSIIPISVAFQLSHYLTLVLVEMQNLGVALSDPFARGWDLFGMADHHVTTSFLFTFEGVQAIFNTQTAAIALGHVVAVILAHALMLDHAAKTPGKTRRLFWLELPFAGLMVFYTAFGLWLLSTPRI